MRSSDTIVALASGAGRAGVAVIRVSGTQVRFITETIAGGLPAPREAALRILRHPQTNGPLDQALVLYFPGPRSFTGEDVVEFHCHGSRAVVSALLDSIVTLGPTTRLAEAGEFARRAFLNGKLDLSAIEGMGDLIDSETEWQRRQAFRQMDGELGRLVSAWRGKLLQAMALIEATLDFSDEGDVDSDLMSIVIPLAEALLDEMRNVLGKASFGERLREGFRVVIAGAPNSGKSSLLNAIAKRDVAIVSDIPGTTRDIIELRCDIGGYPVILCDTAGLRATSDQVEQLGVKRALREIEQADLILHLREVGGGFADSMRADAPVLTIATKIDTADAEFLHDIAISTKTGAGIDDLLVNIEKRLDALSGGETALIANARQRHALARAIEPLDRLSQSFRLQNAVTHLPPELVAEEFRQVTRSLDQLVGRIDVEMVLDALFSRFCIGK